MRPTKDSSESRDRCEDHRTNCSGTDRFARRFSSASKILIRAVMPLTRFRRLEPLLRLLPSVPIELSNRLCVRVPPGVQWLAKRALDSHEPVLEQILALVLRPGDLCIDVGAAYGWFTVIAGKLVWPDGDVIAFEPDDSKFRVMIRYLRANAVWPAYRCLMRPITGSYTLSDFLRSQRIHHTSVRFLKVDVDGVDLDVLEGFLSSKTKSKANRWLSVSVEFGPHQKAHGTTLEDLVAWFESAGYREIWINPRRQMAAYLYPDMPPADIAVNLYGLSDDCACAKRFLRNLCWDRR